MAYPRSRYVKESEEGGYYCFSRYIRRAFLCGSDPLTGLAAARAALATSSQQAA